MATSNQKPVKTVTINYVDPAPGQSTQLEIINDPGGNVGEVQFKTTGGIFGGSNAFVWNNTTSNLGVRGNLSVTGNIYGNISASSTNLKIKGGVSGDVLITDGTGNLTWTSLQDAGGYGNNEVANYLPTFEGELSAGNADLGNAVTANFFIGNGSLLTGLPAGYANSNVANYLPTYTGNLTAGNANLGNAVTANYFTGNLYGTANLATFATTANGVALANVSGIGNIANINLTGSNSNVLYSNGVFAPVGSANTGNWGFRNDTMYNMAGGEINNGDPTHGATSGLVLPQNGNAGLGASLFNTYGNIQINVANLANSANTKVWEFGEDGRLTVPGIITKANTVQLTSSGATNAAAVIASGDHGRVTLRTDDGTTNKDWYFNVDGTTTFPDNTLKAINGANAVAPSTVGTAGASLTISAGTGGIAATSVNAGNGGDLTINAGDAGSDIGNPSWGAIGGTLVLRGGNSTRPYAGSNVEIRSGNSASIPGAISLHTGTNQWTFDATGNLTVPGSLINDTSIVLSAPAVFNICTIATAGSGYNTGSSLKATTGGSGTGMTVGIGYGLSNQLSSVTVVDPGTGYVNGDVITVSEGTGGTFVITKYNQLANQTNNNTVQTDLTFANNTLTLPTYGEIIAPGNITANNIGNITPINLDGSSSNVLYGNGVFAPSSGGGAVISNGTSNVSVVTADGNVVIGVDNDAHSWTFATDGALTLPIGVSIDYNGNVQYPKIIADSGKLFSVQGQGNTGSAALAWSVDPNAASQYAAVAVNRGGGDDLAKVILQAQSDSGNVATAKTWQFNETGTLTLPAGSVIGETANTTVITPPGALAGQSLVIRPTGSNTEDSHIHLVADNTATFDLYLGDDDQYVKIEKNGGNVVIGTDTNSRQWTFDFNGTTTFPGNLVIAGNTSVFGTNGALIQSTDDLGLLTLSSGANGAVSSLWVEDIGNVGTSNIAAVYANPTVGSKIVRIAVGQNGGNTGPNLWDFDATGNLTLPTGGHIIVSGGIVGSGASPAPSINGFSSANFAGNVTTDNILLTDGLIRSGVNTVITDGINSIALGLGAIMDVYGFPFTQPTRGQLTISGITSTTQANGTWYYESINNNDYKLYTDNTYTTLVDSTSWTPYTGGGSVAITKSTTPINIVLDTNGFLTTFTNDGNLVLPGSLTVAGDVTANNLGNIVSTNLDGNVSNVLAGNGTWIAAGGGGGVAEASFSIQSSNFNAAEGSRYGVNTSAGAVTATLPASPSTGGAIFFADAGGAFASNNLTINPNSQTIMGASGNMTVSNNNQSFGLFFNGATWRTYN